MSRKLIDALDHLKETSDLTLEHIVEHLGHNALLVLSLMAIMPFMQPIPIPGLSTVLGLIIFLQGVGLVFLNKPILTEKLKSQKITPETFNSIYNVAVRFTNITSKLSLFKHPVTQTKFFRIVCGISVILSSAFLSLPLPIPFSNFIPALSIFLICLGLLEEDLALIVIGEAITISVIWMAIFSYHLIKEHLSQWF